MFLVEGKKKNVIFLIVDLCIRIYEYNNNMFLVVIMEESLNMVLIVTRKRL